MYFLKIIKVYCIIFLRILVFMFLFMENKGFNFVIIVCNFEKTNIFYSNFKSCYFKCLF